MKKIMFNDKYGLTQAVLEGRKTMTRRVVPTKLLDSIKQYAHGSENELCYRLRANSSYYVGEVVAIAQCYYNVYGYETCISERDEKDSGIFNKMFVRAESMPHHIKITNIRVERLQEISDEDCLKEGLIYSPVGVNHYGFYSQKDNCVYYFYTPREAFAALIDKVSGKGTWDSNPLVWVYEFELVD